MSYPRRRNGFCGRILGVTGFDEHPVISCTEDHLLIGIVAAAPQSSRRVCWSCLVAPNVHYEHPVTPRRSSLALLCSGQWCDRNTR